MRYTLSVHPSDGSTAVELSEMEFGGLREARNSLAIIESTEEKLGILLGNYEDFEAALLTQAVHNVVFQDIDSSRAADTVYLVNRRVINLLTSGRLYLEHIRHDLSSVYGHDADLAKVVISETCTQYDTKLGYRAIEALRNYVQHRGLPVDKVLHSVAPDAQRSDYATHTLTPLLNTGKIKSDGGFKQSVLGELISSFGDAVDLKMLVREYIKGISEVHRAFRTAVAGDVEQWERVLTDTMNERRIPHYGLPNLLAVQTNDDGDVLEELFLSQGMLLRRRELMRRMPLHGHLREPIISSEANGSRIEL